eukprot:5844527-Prymnesium_polylepis.2
MRERGAARSPRTHVLLRPKLARVLEARLLRQDDVALEPRPVEVALHRDGRHEPPAGDGGEGGRRRGHADWG